MCPGSGASWGSGSGDSLEWERGLSWRSVPSLRAWVETFQKATGRTGGRDLDPGGWVEAWSWYIQLNSEGKWEAMGRQADALEVIHFKRISERMRRIQQ